MKEAFFLEPMKDEIFRGHENKVFVGKKSSIKKNI